MQERYLYRGKRTDEGSIDREYLGSFDTEHF